MLLPLLRRFPAQVRVSLFHTPNLRGLLRRLMPERFNETIGLQHIKVYLFDDSVILSGCVPPPPAPGLRHVPPTRLSPSSGSLDAPGLHAAGADC